MKIIRIVSSVLLTITIITLFFLNSFETVVFDIEHYKKEYSKNNIYEKTALSSDVLLFATKDIMEYLKGNKEEFVIYNVENGKELFNDREKMHMDDVQNLFIKAYIIRRYIIYFLIMILFFSLLLFRKNYKFLFKYIFYTCIAIIATLLIITFIVSLDFNRYFIMFHNIFFDNDLWILNPKVDLLVNIVPQAFFSNTIAKIIKLFSIKVSLLIIISIIFYKKMLTFIKI